MFHEILNKYIIFFYFLNEFLNENSISFFLSHFWDGVACDGVKKMKKINFHSTAEYKITEQKFWTTQLVCKKNHLVVALTETWTSEFNNAKLFQIENCQEIILCNRKKRWVGVVIYI